MNESICFDEIYTLLTMPRERFEDEVRIPAWKGLVERNGGRVYSNGLLALSNRCRNNCLYCGLRREKKMPRFALEEEAALGAVRNLKALGLERIFFISGETSSGRLEMLLRLIEFSKSLGLEVNLAAGIFSVEDYRRMKDAGLDLYTIKFETSNPDIFSACKPDIPFQKRMDAVRGVKEAGLMLGSGNIVGLKGQTLEDVAEDIRLMVELGIDWAPVVPYLPAPGTPMAEDTPMGDVDLTLRVLSLLRLYLPDVRITAGQPLRGSSLGFADPEGNRRGLLHGADTLFVEMTPGEAAEQFDIVSSRKLARLKDLKRLTADLGLRLI